MPVKKLKKPSKTVVAPESGVSITELEKSENDGVIIVLATIIVILGVAIGIIALKYDKLQSQVYAYKRQQIQEFELRSFISACADLKAHNNSFIYWNKECFNTKITLSTIKEVKEAIRHYELGSGK